MYLSYAGIDLTIFILADENHRHFCFRDILLCCGISMADVEIWQDLLSHMDLNGHHRALLDTLLILR